MIANMATVVLNILIDGSLSKWIKDHSTSSLVLPKPKESRKCNYLRILLAMCFNIEKGMQLRVFLVDIPTKPTQRVS